MIIKYTLFNFLFCILFPKIKVQNIFNNLPETCQYFVKDPEGKIISLKLQNTIWTIKSKNNKDDIHFNLCNRIPNSFGCNSNVSACLINTRNKKKSLLNLGTHFECVVDEETSMPILKSVNGQRCIGKTEEMYTLVIHFECQSNMQITPRLLYKDDCHLHVKMIHPSCTPLCTIRVNENLLNFRNLRSLGTMNVTEDSLNTQFKIRFCETSIDCGDGIFACQLTGKNIIALGQTVTQHITIDKKTNQLVIKGYSGTAKRTRKDVQIKLVCNWSIHGVRNLKYIVVKPQGRSYKFIGESSFACFKLPQECLVIDPTDHYLVYNLTTLNKKHGSWKVGNVSNGEIYLNVCGPLHKLSPNTTCSDQYSQVCLIANSGHFINLGSIATNFHVEGDIVKGKFTAGSSCLPNETYHTEIEFLCNHIEEGPILHSNNGCTFIVRWKTPTACSKHFSKGNDCLMNDITGNINLNGIHTDVDRIHKFTDSSYLIYNLCGSLIQTCNNMDASVCFVKNNRERVVGYLNKNLIRDDVSLSLNLVGDRCSSSRESITQVYFYCNYLVPSQRTVRVEMVEENCNFKIIIESPLACPRIIFNNCELYHNDVLYNLTLLQSYDNYLIRSSDTNIVYILSICRSIVNTKDTLCPANSGVCMKNLTELDIKYKYLSVGNADIQPVFKDNQLIIHYNYGAYCPESDLSHHSAIIHFQCHTHEEGPRFLKKDICLHEFFWKTPVACGDKHGIKVRSSDVPCQYEHSVTKRKFNFSSITKSIILNLPNGDTYEINLCNKNYNYCLKNGTECNTFIATINFKVVQNGTLEIPYLKYHVRGSQVSYINIFMFCDASEENGNYIFRNHIHNRTIDLNLFANLFCVDTETISITEHITDNNLFINSLINDDFQPKKVFNESTLSYKEKKNKPLLKEKVCYITSAETGGIVSLKDIHSIKIISSFNQNNYNIDLNNGSVYKNTKLVITRDKCPGYQFNHTHLIVKLFLTSYRNCNDQNSNFLQSEVWLQCSSSNKSYIAKESECHFIAIYPLEDVCSLFKSKEFNEPSTGIAIGTSFGVLLLAALLLLGIYIYFRRLKQTYQSIKGDDKTNIMVYYKNTEL